MQFSEVKNNTIMTKVPCVVRTSFSLPYMLPGNASKASTSIRAFFAFLESASLSKQNKGSPHRVDTLTNYLHGHIATYFFMGTRLGSLKEIVKNK